MKRWLTILACAVGAVLPTGCAIRPDAAPVEIDRVNPNSESNDADAEGSYRVYFVGPGERRLLRSVPREAVSRTDLIQLLLQGPNDTELRESFSTWIPANTKLNSSVSSIGTVLIVDIGAEITELNNPAQIQALAQIVYTATDLEGIDKVKILVNGEEVDWPTEVGTASRSGLRVYDFPDAVESSQPDYPAVA